MYSVSSIKFNRAREVRGQNLSCSNSPAESVMEDSCQLSIFHFIQPHPGLIWKEFSNSSFLGEGDLIIPPAFCEAQGRQASALWNSIPKGEKTNWKCLRVDAEQMSRSPSR